jgi:hypothetical protein
MIRQHFHRFDEHAVLCRCCQQHVLEPCLNIINKNLAPVFRAPDDVILETENRSCVVTVPAARCSDFHVMSLPRTYYIINLFSQAYLSPEGDSPRLVSYRAV